LGIGDWGLGVGGWGVWVLGPGQKTPHPPPHPKPQQKYINLKKLKN